ncbi:hypothetical protein G9A89_000073 [Geosiphon pyriformis]|nr:hypothetical protein G9A89_000073 [Geosiphon pyriformis]
MTKYRRCIKELEEKGKKLGEKEVDLEELSSILPSVTYSSTGVILKTTTKVDGDLLTSVLLWDNFLEEVNQFHFNQQLRFKRLQFAKNREMSNEENVCDALNANIYFNCFLGKLLILVIEVKRKCVLEDIGGRTFSEFYQDNNKTKMIVQQIYNYMGANECRYSIITTYNNYWFLRREHTMLWISETFSLQSKSPLVLKVYAYLAQQAKNNFESLNLSSTQSANQQLTTSTSIYQQLSNAFDKLYNFAFTDFKFMNILGQGRSSKMLLCEFYSEIIALKTVDLAKVSPYVLEEIQKEIEIYESFANIQGQYISKLVCHGYYRREMCFIIELTIVGTLLDKHKITKQQNSRALKALETIYKHNILQNNIWKENILVDDSGDIYLIDFGIASQADTKKK